MRPTLEPGDRVMVMRWLRITTGDLVVVRDPEARSTYLIKRARMWTGEGSLEVRGDNPNVSRDSREFGPVPRRLVVGRVRWRYSPAERRAWL